MSKNRQKIRMLMFYEFKQGRNAAEAARNICATLGRKATTHITCRRWFAKFRSGNTHRKDKARSGRPSIIDKRALLRSIESDPTQTTRKLAVDFHSSKNTIANHLHKLGRRGQTVPHELN